MVTRLSDMDAVNAALSVGIADPASLPSSGTHLEWNGKQILLAGRNGQFLAWDISVYSSSGALLTDSYDVYVNAVGEAVKESAVDIGKILGITAIIVIGVMIWRGTKKS